MFSILFWFVIFLLYNVQSSPVMVKETTIMEGVLEPNIFKSKDTISSHDNEEGDLYVDTYSVFYDSNDGDDDYFVKISEPTESGSKMVGFECKPVYEVTDLIDASTDKTNEDYHIPLHEVAKEQTTFAPTESTTTEFDLEIPIHHDEYQSLLDEYQSDLSLRDTKKESEINPTDALSENLLDQLLSVDYKDSDYD